MSDIVLRDATAADWADVLALNQAHRPHVGALTPAGLRQLHERAIRFRLAEAAGTLAGFLIALDPSAEYGSPNFLWFKARYERFAYIDRVAVVAARRRHGVGRRLYEDLETVAGARGFDLLAREYNLRPPNADSAWATPTLFSTPHSAQAVNASLPIWRSSSITRRSAASAFSQSPVAFSTTANRLSTRARKTG